MSEMASLCHSRYRFGVRAISGAMDDSALRIATNVFVILMLDSMAMSLFSTLASMIIPCSVKIQPGTGPGNFIE